METEILIAGSGPSGVSAALPLAEAGRRILILDGGRRRATPPPRGRSYHTIRRTDRDQWRLFLGRELEGLRGDHPPSPKFDAPGSRFAFEGFAASQRIRGEGFAVAGSLAQGGFSNIWGAGICIFDDDDLAAFPVTPLDLADSYARVVRRVGVSGLSPDDLVTDLDAGLEGLPPLALSDNARYLLARYRRRRSDLQALGVRMGQARTAVLTVAREGREPCALCDLCLWGCGENAIWSATHDLDALRRFPNVEHRPGTTVDRIERDGSAYRLTVRTSAGGEEVLRAPTVVLAAGTLVTTRLVLELEDRERQSVPVVGAPAIGFAVLLPARLGSPLSTRDYSMAQISFRADGNRDRATDACYGNLFPASGIPASLIIGHMPLSVPVATRLFRRLQSALMLGNCFLPGHYSRNAAHLERDGTGRAHLVVRGGYADDLPQRLERLRRQMARAFRRLGAHLLPSSFKLTAPGEDLRPCGTLPMRAAPGPGEVDRSGELHGYPGLHVVDLSIFPTMPAKHHVLTLMANADRIGRALAARPAGRP